MNENISTFEDLQEQKQKLIIAEQVMLNKALTSNDVDSIFKAQTYIDKNIKQRQDVDQKSMLVDPFYLNSSTGYKDRGFSLSYDVLRAMSRTHVIKSIIETRKDQIMSFCEPQKDKYSPGFIVQKREKFSGVKKEVKLSKKEEQRIEDIIEFLLQCGNTENFWHGDTFDEFIGKIVTDSLTLDQAVFEIVRNRKGQIIEFFACDGGTYRVADSLVDSENQPRNLTQPKTLVRGYEPSHVQIYQSNVMASFYPWELCFGLRNPTTDIRLNGYGRSELEDMIQVVTAIINSDQYNMNFFKVGSSPKGILKYTGNINPNTVEEFKKQWQTQVAGVMNMHKIPLINADKLDFINTHVPNKDMEFSRFQEFLIKISCALYKIDPSEIGFPMSGSSDSKPMFEGNNEARLKYSRDKGLKPLLKRIQFWINKWLVWQLDRDYEFRFVGIEDENSKKDDLDQDIQKLSNFETINEVRRRRNLKDIEGGDIIANPSFLQAKQQEQMMAMQGNQGANQMMDEEEGGGDEEQDYEGPDEFNNPFMKALKNELPKLLNKED